MQKYLFIIYVTGTKKKKNQNKNLDARAFTLRYVFSVTVKKYIPSKSVTVEIQILEKYYFSIIK